MWEVETISGHRLSRVYKIYKGWFYYPNVGIISYARNKDLDMITIQDFMVHVNRGLVVTTHVDPHTRPLGGWNMLMGFLGKFPRNLDLPTFWSSSWHPGRGDHPKFYIYKYIYIYVYIYMNIFLYKYVTCIYFYLYINMGPPNPPLPIHLRVFSCNIHHF